MKYILAVTLLMHINGLAQKKTAKKHKVKQATQVLNKKPVEIIKEPNIITEDINIFMLVLVKELSLNKSYGIKTDIETILDPAKIDSNYLKEFIISETTKESPSLDSMGFPINKSIKTYEIPKTISKADYKFMLKQHNNNIITSWDNSLFGFKLGNYEQYYAFSKPLFSLNKKQVIVRVDYKCPGQCGIGQVFIFNHDGNTWNYKTASYWIF